MLLQPFAEVQGGWPGLAGVGGWQATTPPDFVFHFHHLSSTMRRVVRHFSLFGSLEEILSGIVSGIAHLHVIDNVFRMMKMMMVMMMTTMMMMMMIMNDDE